MTLTQVDPLVFPLQGSLRAKILSSRRPSPYLNVINVKGYNSSMGFAQRANKPTQAQDDRSSKKIRTWVRRVWMPFPRATNVFVIQITPHTMAEKASDMFIIGSNGVGRTTPVAYAVLTTIHT